MRVNDVLCKNTGSGCFSVDMDEELKLNCVYVFVCVCVCGWLCVCVLCVCVCVVEVSLETVISVCASFPPSQPSGRRKIFVTAPTAPSDEVSCLLIGTACLGDFLFLMNCLGFFSSRVGCERVVKQQNWCSGPEGEKRGG